MAKKVGGVCGIRRTASVTFGTLNMATGARVKRTTKIVTEPCGTPLFTDDERNAGICRTCSSGWEVAGNRFATPKERARATGRKTDAAEKAGK